MKTSVTGETKIRMRKVIHMMMKMISKKMMTKMKKTTKRMRRRSVIFPMETQPHFWSKLKQI
jgi:hypothetical protein